MILRRRENNNYYRKARHELSLGWKGRAKSEVDEAYTQRKRSLDTPVTRTTGELEAPLSNRKAREVLGFKEAHDWRKHVNG